MTGLCCVLSEMRQSITPPHKAHSIRQDGPPINQYRCRCCSCAKTMVSVFQPIRPKAGLRRIFKTALGWNILQPTDWISTTHLMFPAKRQNLSANANGLRSCTCVRCGSMAMPARMFRQLICQTTLLKPMRQTTRSYIPCASLKKRALLRVKTP